MGRKAGNQLAKARAARNSERDRQYALQHPVRAREERALRIANAKVHEDWGHKVHGTPETHAKAAGTRQGALARLFMAGSIDADQLAWSAEIRRVHERIGADVAIGTVSLETRVDGSRSSDGTFFEKLGAVRAEVAYSHWRRAIGAPAIVLAIVVEDLACSAAAARFHRDSRTVRALLIDALDLWPAYQRQACDEIDEATLLAAQAAIL